jgi:hypothetical protein
MSLCFVARAGVQSLLVVEGPDYYGDNFCRCVELDDSMRVLRTMVLEVPQGSLSTCTAYAKAVYSSAADKIVVLLEDTRTLEVHNYSDFSLCCTTGLPAFSDALALLADEKHCMLSLPTEHKMAVYRIEDATLVDTKYIHGRLIFRSFMCFANGNIFGCTSLGETLLLDHEQLVAQQWLGFFSCSSHDSGSAAVCGDRQGFCLVRTFESSSRCAWISALLL